MIGTGLVRAAMATVLLAIFASATVGLDSARAAQKPSLKVDLPRQVEVGHPVEVRLSVEGSTGIGGYETNLLFDRGAAEFSSLIQQNEDLTKLSRDVGPLGPVETPDGVSIGAFSCPVNDCVEPEEGTTTERGVRGTVDLATVTVVPTKPGRLELRLDATKIVDAAGRPVEANLGRQKFVVRVGDAASPDAFAAPRAVSWDLKTRSRPGPFDLTGDGKVTHADAMEAAVAWTFLREEGAACGEALEDHSRDVNHDGCIDVADLQGIVANYDTGEDATARSVAEDRGEPPNPVLATLSSFVRWMSPRAALAQSAHTTTVNSEADTADANLGNGICATSKGVCTLRAAIQEANLRPGPDTIVFDIPGSGVRTIQLGSRLPDLFDESGPTTIDGYTQPGSSPNTDPLVSNAAIGVQITAPAANEHARDALVVTSAGNVIRGLSFFKLRKSIVLYGAGATGNSITGSFVGTDAAGTFSATREVFPADGIVMQAGATDNSVGGTSEAERNVVSGNAYRGVATFGEATHSNRIVNNIVGLGPAGDKRLPNYKHGIDVNGGSNRMQVGGLQPGERNVVSGNGMEGVEISHDPTTTGNEVIGNFIGTDVTGTGATTFSHNDQWGVNVEDRVRDNTISDNVIGNNGKGGIRIANLSTGTVMERNRIGVSLDDRRIPNNASGVQIDSDAHGQRVGPDNVIAYNGQDGVRVGSAASDRNTVTENSIFDNRGLGIDIAPLGQPNPNDADDSDNGPNEQLNFPETRTVTPENLTGTACGDCVVEVYVADGGNGANGEGKTLAGSTVANPDGTFGATLTGVSTGEFVTALATDTQGNTSEFSPNREVSDDAAPPAAPTNLAATPSRRSVGLDWDDNTEQDFAGYSVYRSTTSGGPYAKVTTSLLPSSSYTDTSVAVGTAYYYVVTATDELGNESGFGNEETATPFDDALSFDGNGDQVTIPDSGLLNRTGTGQRTYEFRLKTGPDVNTRQFVYDEGGGSGNGSGFSVEVQGGRIYFNAWSLSNGWGTASASAPISPDTIYRVAGVYHNPSGEMRIYLDGELRGTSSGTGVMKSHGEGGLLGMVAGTTRDHNGAVVSSGSGFVGLIDDFRVWKHARTQAEIAGDMNAELSGNEANLIVVYRMDEGSGGTLNDATPNNLDGTVSGASWATVD